MPTIECTLEFGVCNSTLKHSGVQKHAAKSKISGWNHNK